MEGMTLQKKNKIKEKPTSMIPYGKAFMSSLRFSKDDTITRVAFNARKSSKPKMTMSLEYLPYVRTCEGSSDEPSTLNLRYCLQEEEITGEKECRDKKDFFPSIGFFPYYRSQDEFLNNTILRHRFGRKHSIKFRNEEKRGDANRKFANHNCGASLLGFKPNFDLQSLTKNSPPRSPFLFFSSETSEENQLEVSVFSDDTICSTGFIPYYRTEEVLLASPIPIFFSSVSRGYEWGGTEIRRRNWMVPAYYGVCRKHSKS
ncbi:uncharacterized protein LOC141519285 isoform X1 [Macrotis lagotis]|uniref:uncharacterized protein LOC141519285 isoform X1 n=1 Tax=Macrotis lagotis TaxID=92651 RepID=UPI003D686285